jgi:uncharacterized metal-binding protein YceD (DUF177 family)
MSVISWAHRDRDIPSRGLEESRSATVEERQNVAIALELVGLERLDVSYLLLPSGGGRFRLELRLEADFTQSCVVTLDPVAGQIRESVEIELWPAADLKSGSQNGAPSLDAPEPIENGVIDIGRIVVDELAAALDPYPRKAGTIFSWQEATAEGEPPSNPFAELKNRFKPTS